MKLRPGGGGGARRHGSAALSLSAFAGAKASTYDKRARLERERALNAKKARARRRAAHALSSRVRGAVLGVALRGSRFRRGPPRLPLRALTWRGRR